MVCYLKIPICSLLPELTYIFISASMHNTLSVPPYSSLNEPTYSLLPGLACSLLSELTENEFVFLPEPFYGLLGKPTSWFSGGMLYLGSAQ